LKKLHFIAQTTSIGNTGDKESRFIVFGDKWKWNINW